MQKVAVTPDVSPSGGLISYGVGVRATKLASFSHLDSRQGLRNASCELPVTSDGKWNHLVKGKFWSHADLVLKPDIAEPA